MLFHRVYCHDHSYVQIRLKQNFPHKIQTLFIPRFVSFQYISIKMCLLPQGKLFLTASDVISQLHISLIVKIRLKQNFLHEIQTLFIQRLVSFEYLGIKMCL